MSVGPLNTDSPQVPSVAQSTDQQTQVRQQDVEQRQAEQQVTRLQETPQNQPNASGRVGTIINTQA
ncbi:hypothetical protein LJ739_03210 [Aestuariibacter halophilus]|uniref:Uncharacterized protein n=1 Tax=Fluctibacter halophilus TaxID=226011 RepID=A0ABS8G557_9ALTE|nr:hypothetical protein [Aestuariibacter halophilus]MCC2615246.1 hypothetical protein [Aestuariibacter halophilus]